RRIGAALWHMGVAVGAFGLKTADYQAPFGISYAAPGFIYVNKHGRRFTNETGWELHFAWQALCAVDPRSPGYPTLPFYGVCDRDTLRKGALHAGASGTSRSYQWSADNSAEVARGWISEGKSLDDLARRLAMDPAILERTVARYNQACNTGLDADFQRAKDTLRPLVTPPYYAVELSPWLVNTMGGPRRDARARVVDTGGRPIPRLYSAGELGSLWGHLYCGGGNVCEALAVGRIAGRNAAAETPRP
ncbi:MAG: FAD-binding protein, partial [Burkholderiales bacterium]|nr:FAD-binding protein [Burkholderiales bacterium]